MKTLGLLATAFLISASTSFAGEDPGYRIIAWERGIALHPRSKPGMRVYLWFYEWNMFGAVDPAQHTRGDWDNRVTVNEKGTAATIACPPHFTLKAGTTEGGINLTLTAENNSTHNWPELAGIVACFNPGPAPERNPRFSNTKTSFHGPGGLVRLESRQIHFNAALRKAVDTEADTEGNYLWSTKWPKTGPDATRGLILRESTEPGWVTAIAWDRFLSAQGHNPWECMHLAIHLGPLESGATRTVHGKIYLLEGDKDDLLARYNRDTAKTKP